MYYKVFYHSEKLQCTKTMIGDPKYVLKFYHSEKLQCTKISTTQLSTFVSFRYNKT